LTSNLECTSLFCKLSLFIVGDAVKVIKQQVVKIIDAEEQSQGSTASGQD